MKKVFTFSLATNNLFRAVILFFFTVLFCRVSAGVKAVTHYWLSDSDTIINSVIEATAGSPNNSPSAGGDGDEVGTEVGSPTSEDGSWKLEVGRTSNQRPPDLKLRTSDLRHRTSDFGLRASDN